MSSNLRARQSKANSLKAAAKSLLIPHLSAAGFQPDGRPIWTEDKEPHLTDRFLRWRGGDLDLLEIQYDPCGRGAFALEFGVAPPGGIDYCGYHYDQKDASVYITNRARLGPSRINHLRRFGFPLLRIPLLRNPSAETVVRKAIELFPQVEAWLSNGIRGANIALIPIPKKPVL